VDVPQLRAERPRPRNVILLITAVQRVLDELVPVLEQIGAELAARARKVVECVEVELAGKLSDYAVGLTWLACIRAWSQVLAEVRLTDNSSGRR
jgi:hypothetical protein